MRMNLGPPMALLVAQNWATGFGRSFCCDLELPDAKSDLVQVDGSKDQTFPRFDLHIGPRNMIEWTMASAEV